MAPSRIPELDDELRRRLGRRFGPAVELWLDALPPVLSDLADAIDSASSLDGGPSAALVSPELYERGRQLAMRLAADTPAAVLLHGDLTPVNILDGGEERGLVAIDPAPCVGDPAFDAIDLVLWRAEDVETIAARAERLAPAIGAEAGRLWKWCAAFAAMIALEIAEASDHSRARVEPFVAFARAET